MRGEIHMALAPEKAPYLFTVAEYLTFERAADKRHETWMA